MTPLSEARVDQEIAADDGRHGVLIVGGGKRQLPQERAVGGVDARRSTSASA